MSERCSYKYDIQLASVSGQGVDVNGRHDSFNSDTITRRVELSLQLFKSRCVAQVAMNFRIECSTCTLNTLFPLSGNGEAGVRTQGVGMGMDFINRNCPINNSDSPFVKKSQVKSPE